MQQQNKKEFTTPTKKKKKLSCSLLHPSREFSSTTSSFHAVYNKNQAEESGRENNNKRTDQAKLTLTCEKLGQHTKFTPTPLTSISKGLVKIILCYQFQFRSRWFLCPRKSPYALNPVYPVYHFPNVAFETVPMFVRLTTVLSRPGRSLTLAQLTLPTLLHLHPKSAPDFDPDITVIAPIYHNAHKSPAFSVSELWEWRQMACNGMWATLGPALQLRWVWLTSIPGQPSVNAESGTQSSAPKCLPV